ncbi:MAG: sigma 54-interacting transcriptional regulator [Terriglobales bacterium]|jgi:formate hydrogenlyase transcriptional activator
MSSLPIPDHSFNSLESSSARAELQRESDRLKLLLEMTNTLVSNLELRDLLRAVSANIRQVMHCDYVAVWLPDSEQCQLRQLALDFPESKGIAREDWLQPVEGSAIGRVFKTGKPLVVDVMNEQSAPVAAPSSRAEGLKFICVLPLISRNRTLGVLTLGSRVENAFRPEDVDFLSRAAGQVAIAIENALAYREIAELKDKLAEEKFYLEDEIRTEHNFEDIVGESPTLRRVLQQVETVARTDSTVLILGETGTGKELIARAIHHLSNRRDRALVKLNCAAIPTGLLESELFGHEKGAFTGAIAQKIGRVELANKGTLFLDEVGDIPLELQPKLLRVLQEQEFERLGGIRTIRVDARLVVATNRDLDQMVAQREFRQDLFYRLNIFPIRVPPLRERVTDIPLLVNFFVNKHAKRMGKRIERVPAETMHALACWHWPGNVRELENVIERALILSQGPVLNVPLTELRRGTLAIPSTKVQTFEASERELILRALREANGVIASAAGKLGIKRTTLNSKMRKLHVSRSDLFSA